MVVYAKNFFLILFCWGLFCFAVNVAAGEEFKANFFRAAKAGQKFHCEAKADYLSEYYFTGSIKSVKTPFKSRQIELFGILNVVEAADAQPSVLELKIAQMTSLEDGAKHQSGLEGQTIIIRRDSNGKTVFACKESGKAVTAQNALLLGMIFDLESPEPAGKTIYGYPGSIQVGGTWAPDLDLFRSQLMKLNLRPEKLNGKVVLQEKQSFEGIECLFLTMNIYCGLAGGETFEGTWHAVFPVDNATYGPVKKHLSILRKRQIKLPETDPLTAGRVVNSEERFHLETVLLPVKTN